MPVRNEWVGRALFESALILLGLLGAFALNEWQDSRERRGRADAMMTAIRAELEVNLKQQDVAAAYNSKVVEAFRKLRAEGVRFAPSDAYENGLVALPTLTSTAWDAARGSEAIDEIPVETLLVLGRTYDYQREYAASMRTLLEMFYQIGLEQTRAPSGGVEPARVTGTLSDYANRARFLVGLYRSTLEHLNKGSG